MAGSLLAPELLAALQKTDFDGDINWTTMPLPFESGILVLPRGGYAHPLDGDCAFIVWDRCKAGAHAPGIPGLPVVYTTHMTFSLVALCPKEGVWYDSTLTARVRPTLKLRNLFYLRDGEEVPSIRCNTKWDETATAAGDKEFIDGIGVIAFGALLALAAKPELRTKARIIRTVPGKKGAASREFWSPNIIGKDYKLRGVSGTGGLHASPRMHWRRGHFRQQPVGPT